MLMVPRMATIAQMSVEKILLVPEFGEDSVAGGSGSRTRQALKSHPVSIVPSGAIGGTGMFHQNGRSFRNSIAPHSACFSIEPLSPAVVTMLASQKKSAVALPEAFRAVS